MTTLYTVPVPEDTGKVSPVIGSGKLEITSAVEVNSTRDYVIKYTPATALDKAYLIVGLPTDVGGNPFEDGAGEGISALVEDADGTDGGGKAIYGYLNVEDNQEIATNGTRCYLGSAEA